jgi:hypothetical protein
MVLPWTTRKTCTIFFAKVDHMDCEIITFEVERQVFSHCPWQFDYLWRKIFELRNFELLHSMLGTCVPNLRGRRWVEQTQMHLALKKGTRKFHYTSNSCGILWWFHFFMKIKSQRRIWRSKCPLILGKKMKKSEISKLHKEWKIKCRSKLQKMEVLYIHSSKMGRNMVKWTFRNTCFFICFWEFK